LGVTSIRDDVAGSVSVTGLERTLIDSTVRPFYSGGVFEVLRAYQKAKGRLSVRVLAELLQKLEFVYPFHQAVGFYLEKAGYGAPDVSLMRSPDFRFDFYLTRQMKAPVYSSRWRLFYPKGL
jgi:hypothetical protein